MTLSERNNIEGELREVDFCTINKIIRENSIKQWQSSWIRVTSGYWTKELIPSVPTKVKWSNNRNADISYARMLLSSTNLNHDMHRMRLAETPNCECSLDRETIEHHVLHCKKFENEREEMMDEIRRMWMNSRKEGCLNVTIETLLGPNISEKLSKEEDDAVKRALFVFLMTTKRKI